MSSCSQLEILSYYAAIFALFAVVVGWILLWIMPYKQSKMIFEYQEISKIIESLLAIKKQIINIDYLLNAKKVIPDRILLAKESLQNFKTQWQNKNFYSEIEPCITTLEALSENNNDGFNKIKEKIIDAQGVILSISTALESLDVEKIDQNIADIKDLSKDLSKIIFSIKEIRFNRQKPIKSCCNKAINFFISKKWF